MGNHPEDLKILNGLAKSRRQAAEGGQHDTVAVLDAHMMKLEKEMNDRVDQTGDLIPLMEDGSPSWLGKSECNDLTWWWKETAAMHRLQERAEHRKEASLTALLKTIDKNHEEMEKSIHEQPDEDLPELSDFMVDYLKHEAAPHAVEQLKIYLADLQTGERINERVMKELDLTLRWKDSKGSDDQDMTGIDLKTLYPTPRQMLVEDALRALRDYRQALLSYGPEFENEVASKVISTMLHRDANLPKAVAATIPEYVTKSNESCSCGEECIIASLPPLPSPSTTPELSIEDQENIERLKQFDKEVREWSTYLQQELRSYRHYLAAGSQVNKDVLKSAKEIISLAKGKSRTDRDDAEVIVSHGCMGSCSEFAATEGDAEIEDEILRVCKFNEERFANLPDDLHVYYETIANIRRAEVDRQLLRAAQIFIEILGEDMGDQKAAEDNIQTAADVKSETKDKADVDASRLPSEGTENINTAASDLAQQAQEIETATLEMKGEVNSDLVVASEKVTTLMKDSAEAGNYPHDDTTLINEAKKLVKLAKAEILSPSQEITPEPESAKKEKRKKTVRFANKLVEILGFFDHWDEDTEYPTIPSFTTPDRDIQHDDIDILSDSQISHFELDESESQSEPEEQFDIFEDAESRVIGALRCYYFNLGTGTLVTDEKVDDGVSNAVQNIVDMSLSGFGTLESSEGMNLSEKHQGGEPSDEGRMVAELERYMKQVRSHESKPTPEVVDVARKILLWAAERGTVEGGDCP
ncbi:hypothetical protein IFR05_013137 [Cadophora sp. M221]|nr:hypothetical protein IFR05_013137 [Cadophora sp. M221]